MESRQLDSRGYEARELEKEQITSHLKWMCAEILEGRVGEGDEVARLYPGRVEMLRLLLNRYSEKPVSIVMIFKSHILEVHL